MEMDIIEQPIRFRLYGLSSVVGEQSYGEVGCRLMDEMWKIVKRAELATTGINHWVYFVDDRMFVGVEVRNAEQATIPEQFVKDAGMVEADLQTLKAVLEGSQP